eukprot:9725808-Lingulodinium_polyedra.AAC.1
MGVSPVAPAPWGSLSLPWHPFPSERHPLVKVGTSLGRGSGAPGELSRPAPPDKASCDESR